MNTLKIIEKCVLYFTSYFILAFVYGSAAAHLQFIDVHALLFIAASLFAVAGAWIEI